MKLKPQVSCLVAMSIALIVGVVACGDDTEPQPDTGPTPDQFVYMDTQVEEDGMQPDSFVIPDAGEPDLVSPDTSSPDLPPPVEGGVDMAGDMAGDTVVTDGPMGDAGPGATCGSPIPLTLSGGQATATGDTTGIGNEFGMQIKCGGSYDFDGPQLYYSVTLTQGTLYAITVTPTGWDASLYVFKDPTCDPTKINGECDGTDGGYSEDGSSGDAETVYLWPSATGDYIIAVDSWLSTGEGPFTLEVKETVPPGNDLCANADQVNFVSGHYTTQGDTRTAKNDVKLAATDCTGETAEGPDLFYEAQLKASSVYKIELDGTGYDESLYLFTDCSNVAGTCGQDMGSDASTYSAEALTFAPPSDGTYYIGVSGRAASDSGTFDLTIDEYIKATNDNCGAAKPLVLAGGIVSDAGHNIGATDRVNLPHTTATPSCTGYDTEGADLFYTVSLTANTKYRIKVEPESGFNPAVYILDDCTNPTTKCLAGSDSGSSGTDEVIVFTPTASKDYIVVVDSRYLPGDTYSEGSFMLTIEELTPPGNDTCANASGLTFTNGTAVETGDTTAAANEVQLTATDCTGNTTDGPDVFYSATLTAGNYYTLELDGTGFNEALYLFTDCANVAGTCGTDMGADDYSTSSEEITYSPTTGGVHYIGVAGRDATDLGEFTLTVNEYATPAGDVCTAADAITVPATGSVQVKGHTNAAANDVQLTASDCTGDTTDGPDVFYKADLTAGTTYTIRLDGESGWNESLYVFEDCANVATTCGTDMGSDSSTTGVEEVTITPATSKTYYIGVSGRAATDKGLFTLTIGQPAQNGTCTAAEPMTFSTGGKATASGFTLFGSDDVTISSSGCTSPWSTPGPDVFYSITLNANQSYTVTLKPDSSFDPLIYVFTNCSDPEGSCVVGQDTIGSGTAETVTVTPTTTSTYYIGVDAFTGSESGSFTLEVQ
jgi:hypothetical protein